MATPAKLVTITMAHELPALEQLAFNAFDTGYCNYWVASYEDRKVGFTVKHSHRDNENKIVTSRVDAAALERGIQAMAEKYPAHYGNYISENDDAVTADVYLQCCIFGELIFG